MSCSGFLTIWWLDSESQRLNSRRQKLCFMSSPQKKQNLSTPAFQLNSLFLRKACGHLLSTLLSNISAPLLFHPQPHSLLTSVFPTRLPTQAGSLAFLSLFTKGNPIFRYLPVSSFVLKSLDTFYLILRLGPGVLIISIVLFMSRDGKFTEN